VNPILKNVVRTATPAVVGAVATYLTKLSMNINPSVEMVVFPIATSTYYTAIHLLEQKYPKAGWLLGCLPQAPQK